VLRAGLVKLGLVTEPTGTQFKVWATHGVTHWIGLDVHDVGVRGKPLAPGMAFTIEPGIYVREQALNDLPKTAENAAFVEKVRAAVEKYKNIGVRIEDSFLLFESGVENLSAAVPRTLEDVERFLAEAHSNSPQSIPRSR
jgi:Xaa-Pro aminopeptidase